MLRVSVFLDSLVQHSVQILEFFLVLDMVFSAEIVCKIVCLVALSDLDLLFALVFDIDIDSELDRSIVNFLTLKFSHLILVDFSLESFDLPLLLFIIALNDWYLHILSSLW